MMEVSMLRPHKALFSLLACHAALLSGATGQPDSTTPAQFNCKLNATSPFSYVVKIFDTNDKRSVDDPKPSPVSFGSLVHATALLTSGWYYHREMLSPDGLSYSRFRVIGQNIWDYKSRVGLQNPCFQERKVVDVINHPKIRLQGERLYFDFSITVLEKPFDTVTPQVPFMDFSDSPLALLHQIRFVNTRKQTCAMPVPKQVTPKHWVFNDRIDVTALPFHTQCVNYLCEQVKPRLGKWYYACRGKFDDRLNATMLCMVPGWTRHVPKEKTFPTSYAGVPLVCNQTVLGILSQIKDRSMFKHFKQDIFFVLTLLRIYPWLREEIIRTQRRNATTSTPIDPAATATVIFTKPKSLPKEDWGKSDFFVLPRVDNPFADGNVNPKSTAASILRNPNFPNIIFLFVLILSTGS